MARKDYSEFRIFVNQSSLFSYFSLNWSDLNTDPIWIRVRSSTLGKIMVLFQTLFFTIFLLFSTGNPLVRSHEPGWQLTVTSTCGSMRTGATWPTLTASATQSSAWDWSHRGLTSSSRISRLSLPHFFVSRYFNWRGTFCDIGKIFTTMLFFLFQYLLCLATPVEVVLLGVSFTSPSGGTVTTTVQFHNLASFPVLSIV